MIFEIRSMGTGTASIRLPVFSAEDSESGNAARMNTFYEKLAGYIKEFIESEDFPAGGRYRAEGKCTEGEDGSITVSVTLSLHHRGRCTARRVISHTWRDGVIIG